MLLAEDTAVLAFAGAATAPTWLDPGLIPALLDAAPNGTLRPSRRPGS
ncbi:MAG TPA: hypothetical protein VMT69_15155 [Kineosporiaceae bacterium]|nr:hypothetical protein [Kineosporiaceae bacterium]